MIGESVCVVMPAYNESAGIVATCRQWLAAIAAHADVSLIVIDDGSQDGTGRLLDHLAAEDGRVTVVHQANAGHGPALRRGYEAAMACAPDWIFQTDSDAQFFPDDFALLWNARGRAPFVLGVRVARQDPFLRLWISKLCRCLMAVCGWASTTDPNSPFRLLRRDTLARLLKRVPADAFAPNIFLSLLAAREAGCLAELPVRHRARQTGMPSLLHGRLARACLQAAADLVRYRFYARRV